MNDRNYSPRQSGSGPRRPRSGGGSRHGGGNGGSGEGRQFNAGPARGGETRVRSAAHLRNQSFDSNGPDVRVRGNAWQVYEKYQSLARDATSAGDPVMAESYLQHAEHYFRITEAIEEAAAVEQRQRGGSSAPAPFGTQPEMPSNYFAPEGKVIPSSTPQAQTQQPQSPVSGDSESETGSAPQAEVTRRPRPSPPQTTSSFFAEDGDNSGSEPQTLIVRR
jgi:hypothetical protein